MKSHFVGHRNDHEAEVCVLALRSTTQLVNVSHVVTAIASESLVNCRKPGSSLALKMFCFNDIRHGTACAKARSVSLRLESRGQ